MQCLINVCLHSHFQLSTKLGESLKEGKNCKEVQTQPIVVIYFLPIREIHILQIDIYFLS